MPPKGQRFQRLPSSREGSIWDQYQGEYPAKTAWEAPTYQYWYPYPFGDPYAGAGGVSPLEKLTDPNAQGQAPTPPQGTPPTQGASPPTQEAPAVQGGGFDLPGGGGVSPSQTAPQIAQSALGLLQEGSREFGSSGTSGAPFGERTSDAIPPNTQPASGVGASLPATVPQSEIMEGANFSNLPFVPATRGSAPSPSGAPPQGPQDIGGLSEFVPSDPGGLSEFSSGVGAPSPAATGFGAGLFALPSEIIGASTMDMRNTTGASKGGRIVGGTGGAIGGAMLGQSLIPVPGVGAAIGALLGSTVGRSLGGFGSEALFGGTATMAQRQAREAALQRHLAAGAISHMQNVVAGGFQIPDIINYMNSSDNLSNQGFAGDETAAFRDSVWDRMVKTLLDADPVKYGQFLASKFDPQILKGYEDQVGSYEGPYNAVATGGDGGTGGEYAPGTSRLWLPELDNWVELNPTVRDSAGTQGYAGPEGNVWGPAGIESLKGLVYDSAGTPGIQTDEGITWLSNAPKRRV